MRIDKHSALGRALLIVGSLGPLGFLPASGTVTVAVVGIPLAFALHTQPPVTYWLVTLTVTVLAGALHAAGDHLLETKDSSRIVWDELVGYLIAVGLIEPFTWAAALTAFVLERVIDIVKVPPANIIERRWPGAWGVVGDDVVAGLYTCGIMAIVARWVM